MSAKQQPQHEVDLEDDSVFASAFLEIGMTREEKAAIKASKAAKEAKEAEEKAAEEKRRSDKAAAKAAAKATKEEIEKARNNPCFFRRPTDNKGIFSLYDLHYILLDLIGISPDSKYNEKGELVIWWDGHIDLHISFASEEEKINFRFCYSNGRHHVFNHPINGDYDEYLADFESDPQHNTILLPNQGNFKVYDRFLHENKYIYCECYLGKYFSIPANMFNITGDRTQSWMTTESVEFLKSLFEIIDNGIFNPPNCY